MGSLSSAQGRAARTAALIATEDEALAVAGALAGVFALATDGLETRFDPLSRSGLFGISVPTEHGGIDVSNTVLAEICTLCCERSEALGAILAAHFVAVEHVRSHASDSQQSSVFSAVLAGAWLAQATVGPGEEPLALVPSGLGWRLSGAALPSPHAGHADWLLVPVRHESLKAAGLLLPAGSEGLHEAGDRQMAFEDVLVDSAALLQSSSEAAANAVPRALGLLLQAACRRGAGRRALHALLDDPACNPASAGLLAARLAAAGAMIAEAGRAIDAAQIGLADQHRTNAFLAAADALVAAEEAVAGDTATIPPQLAAVLAESGALRLAQAPDAP